MTSKGLIAILAGFAAALVVALPAFAGSSATVVTVIAGKPSELKFTVSKKTVTKGKVTFKVTNKGALDGKAPYLCTVPGHAAAGMRGVLTVR